MDDDGVDDHAEMCPGAGPIVNSGIFAPGSRPARLLLDFMITRRTRHL